MYRLTTDTRLGIITIAVEGFWSVAEVHEFVAALRREAAPFHAAGRKPALLYDYSNAVIQSREVVEAWAEIARRAPAAARRVAVFTEGKLARRQAQRVVDAAPTLRGFEDRAEAIAWLSAGDEAGQGIPPPR